jgi:sugar phosphate permease
MFKRPDVFYGWWIVAVCGAGMFISDGAGFYAFGIFFKPLMEAFECGRTQISVAQSIFIVSMGLSTPFLGRLTDRHGPKLVIAIGGLLSGAGFLLLTFIKALWQLYVIWVLLGVGLAAISLVPASAAISCWFYKKRGLAIGVATAGLSLGGLLLAPAVGYLISWIDWRATYLFLAVLTWVLIVPAAAMILIRRPQDIGLLPDGVLPQVIDNAGTLEQTAKEGEEVADQVDWTLSGAAKTRAFWLMTAAFVGGMLAAIGVLMHQAAFLIDSGIPETTAAVTLGVTAGIGGVGKVVVGYLGDKLSVKRISICCFILQAMGIVALMEAETILMIWLFVILFGFGMGATVTLISLVTADAFGQASLGAILGVVAMAVLLSSAAGPFLTGFVFDATQSYDWAFQIFIGLFVIAALAMLAAAHPQARVAGHSKNLQA